MVQGLRILVSLSEDPVWFPGPTWWCTATSNSSARESATFFWPLRVPGMHVVYTHTHKLKINASLNTYKYVYL